MKNGVKNGGDQLKIGSKACGAESFLFGARSVAYKTDGFPKIPQPFRSISPALDHP